MICRLNEAFHLKNRFTFLKPQTYLTVYAGMAPSHPPLPFEYEIVRRPRRRSLSIVVDERGNVRVLTPTGISVHYILNLLKEKQSWVLEKLHQNRESLAALPEKRYVDGEEFPLMDEKIVIRVKSGKRNAVRYRKESLSIHITLSNPENQEKVRMHLEKIYIKIAKDILPVLTSEEAGKIGITPQKVRIKNVKSRWGSCSSLGNINLNWRLILAPEKIARHVIIHELCHLKHPDHSPDFWAFVSRFDPDYKIHRKWLKENSRSLLL